MHSLDWKESIIWSGVAGVLWGWVSMAVNTLSGVFIFENTLVYNMVIFSVGGAVFAIVIAGFLKVAHDWIPFKSIFAKAVFLSSALWIVLFIGGSFLSSIESERYHFVTGQSLQGLILAIILGGFIGFLWKIKAKEA